MANQPGVMLYFDIRPSLKRLSLEDGGRLFEAIMNYGEFGKVPELEGNLAFVWDFIQPRLDRDARRYLEISEKRREAALIRWEKQNAGASDAKQAMPTTTTNTTSTSTSNSNSAAAPAGRFPVHGRRATKTDEPDFNIRRNAALAMLEEMAREKRLPR